MSCYSYPVFFLMVGLVVLGYRLQDGRAWLLALLFAGCIAAAPLPLVAAVAPPPVVRGLASIYGATLSVLLPAVFYHFFATFPVASPLDRRMPRLKWVLLLAGTLLAARLGIATLQQGDWSLPYVVLRLGGFTYLWAVGYALCGFGLGLTSLLWSGLRAPTGDARRKIRVIVWATTASLSGTLFLIARDSSMNRGGFHIGWSHVTALPLFLLPVAFAYAVVKHRVLDVPVLLKRSARYVLVQRGFVLLLVLSSAGTTLLLVLVSSRFIQPRMEVGVPAWIVMGVGFGALLALAGSQLARRVTPRIDQIFFRGSALGSATV